MFTNLFIQLRAEFDFIRLRKFVDTNLQPFRDGMADYEDEKNRGILSVLNCLVEKFNQLKGDKDDTGK